MAANNKDMKKKSTRMSTTNAKNLKRIDAFLIFYCIRKGLLRVPPKALFQL